MQVEKWASDILEDARWWAVSDAVKKAPDVQIYCFDSDGIGIDPPADVSSRYGNVGKVATFAELVTDEFAVQAIQSWNDVLANGTSLFTAERTGDTETVSIRSVNLIHGPNCVITLVDLDTEKLRQTGTDGIVGKIHVDMVAVIQEADEIAEKLLGYGPGELVGVASTDLLHPSDRPEAILLWLEMLKRPGSRYQHFGRYKTCQGSWIWVEVTHRNLLDSAGYILREIVEATERGDAVMAAADRDRVIQGIADALPSGIAQFDSNLELVFANDRWREMTGIGQSAANGALLQLLIDPTKEEVIEVGMAELASTGAYNRDVTVVPAEGSTDQRRWRLSLRSLENFDGLSSGLVACLDDITESWQLQNKLVQKATHDDLTGLANRTAILDYLEEALHGAADNESTVAVIFLDLNGFKQVNDVLGHNVGDELLVQIADSLKPSVRPTDLVARLGGDEFLVVCSDVGNAATAMIIARRVLDAVTGRFLVGTEVVEMGASCGLTIDTGGTQTAERMIADADLAMYEQKRLGSQDPGLFRASMFTDQRLELNRDAALRTACNDGSLVVHYQPIVALDTGKVVAYEALTRWMFEDRLIFPDGFIGLAERRGLIEDIGAWVLDEVARQAAADPRRDLAWSVNVSPLQLRSGRFGELVEATLARHNLDPSQLVLEITEGLQLTGGESTIESLRQIAKLGVQLFVDDFGSGFASLNYLRTLPVSGLKIDRSFTADVDRQGTQIIVQNVVALAESLSLSLILEGVETEEQAATLASLGVTTCQGYLFARPAPYDEIVAEFGSEINGSPEV